MAMVYTFNTVRVDLDPHERRRRLARLYAFFEKNTAESSQVSQAQEDSTAEASQPKRIDRRIDSTLTAGYGQKGGCER